MSFKARKSFQSFKLMQGHFLYGQILYRIARDAIVVIKNSLLLRYSASIDKQPVQLLINSGASHNFVSLSFF